MKSKMIGNYRKRNTLDDMMEQEAFVKFLHAIRRTGAYEKVHHPGMLAAHEFYLCMAKAFQAGKKAGKKR